MRRVNTIWGWPERGPVLLSRPRMSAAAIVPAAVAASPSLPLAGGRAPAKDRSYRLDTGRLDTGRLVMAPGRGQEVGEDPVDLRIQGQADMAAVDLDRVDIGPQARLPVHDPVGTRVDR